MHHLVFGINFQIHSVSLTILVSIHLLIHLSTHLCHHPHSRHPSLLHSLTPGSKPTFSTNPSHRRFLLPTGLPHDNGTGPDRTYHAHHFILVSHFNFLYIPCGRLSWLPVSLLLHVKYTLLYRIVTRLNFSGPMDNRFPFDNPAVLNVHSTGTDTEEELKLGWQLLASKILDSV